MRKYMMYDISEKYADNTIAHHFLIISPDLVFGKYLSFHKKTKTFLFYICPGYC